MFELMESDENIFGLLGRACQENGISVRLCEDLLDDNDELNERRIRIIKVDQWFSTRRMATPPKSVDCLVVLDCDDGYRLFLVELRGVSSTKGIPQRAIVDKFKATFLQFMGGDFQHIFLDERFLFKRISAWLVADPLNAPELSDENYRRKMLGTVLDFFQSIKPFQFRGHTVFIEPKRPDPILCCDDVEDETRAVPTEAFAEPLVGD